MKTSIINGSEVSRLSVAIQTETEATGAPQNHHHTLNQQVGSITNLQHPVANVLKHMIVAPAIEQNQLPDALPPSKICPVINIAGQFYVVMTHMMVGLPQKELGKCIADLTADRAVLRDAIDFLINGY